MAPFNPQIQPTNDPSFGANSRSVDVANPIRQQGVQQNQILPKGQEIGDRSAEYEGKAAEYGASAEAQDIKGFGDLFAGIASTADFMGKVGVSMVKKDIENKVYEVANNERQSYTAALEKVKNSGTNNILNANASLDEPETPAEIEDLPGTLTALSGARSAGKISNTYYYGRLQAEAKDLRARYPGFREEIDKEFAQVTGVNPANAYVNALVQDINRQGAGKAKDQAAAEKLILANSDLPGAQKMYQRFTTGQADKDDVFNWMAPYHQEKTALQMGQLRLNAFKGSQEQLNVEAGQHFDAQAGATVNNYVQKLAATIGLDNIEGAQQLRDKIASGAVGPEQMKQFGELVENQKVALRLQITRDADKSGLTKQMGGKDKLNAAIDQQFKVFDVLTDRVYNKDSGGFYSAAQSVKAIQDVSKKNLLNDSVVGPYTQLIGTMKELGGEQYLQKLTDTSLKLNMPEKYADYFNRMRMTIQGQPGMAESGKPVTFNTLFNEFEKKKIGGTAEERKISSSILKEVASIADPNTPDSIKANIAMAAFHPDNRGFISRLDMDKTDQNGRSIPGRNAVFQSFTTPEITREMARLGKSNPAIFENYQNWAKETFSNELFNRELLDMNKYTADPNLKVSWDTDNKRFNVSKTNNPAMQASSREAQGGTGFNSSEMVANDQQFKLVSQSVNRINSGLNNLKNVAKESNGDVDSYLFKAMMDTGLDIRNVNDLPGKFAQAMISSRYNKVKGK